VILCGFAAIVGVLTTRQVRQQFNDEMAAAVSQLAPNMDVVPEPKGHIKCTGPPLSAYATAEHAQIRIYDAVSGVPICANQESVSGKKVIVTQPAFELTRPGVSEQFGYRVLVQQITWKPHGEGFLLYARPLSDVDHTLERVRVFLLLGVLGGTVFALLAGLTIAQRAMRPVAELTDAARQIERTRDPSLHIPHPDADDEVAELARTLESMLGALDSARSETESALTRQREFVADASHELRTPLTSVLANLELLAEELDGEQAETAQAALRSTRRMRRLVADLLLLARADAKRPQPHRPTDLAEVLVEVAGELEPVSGDHELTIDPRPAMVSGDRDDLHRLVLNLIENSIRHTPPGTDISAWTSVEGHDVILRVQDSGPGIPPELAGRLFDRFVRADGDGGRGSGLGLAIVRAVTESHAGTVELSSRADGAPGAAFVVRIPAIDAVAATAEPAEHAAPSSGVAPARVRGVRGRVRLRTRNAGGQSAG
jgi:signal transduction histidine kinase